MMMSKFEYRENKGYFLLNEEVSIVHLRAQINLNNDKFLLNGEKSLFQNYNDEQVSGKRSV